MNRENWQNIPVVRYLYTAKPKNPATIWKSWQDIAVVRPTVRQN